MTRMSNKLVYHFLRFNEPPAGVNRRGATLTRFLSSPHCIYGRGGLSQNTPGRARFDTASHPFRGQIFQKSLCTSLRGFGWLADPCLGEAERWQIYNVFSAGCTSCHVLPPPVQQHQDVLAAKGADCTWVFIYKIHLCCRLQCVIHPILLLILIKTAFAL